MRISVCLLLAVVLTLVGFEQNAHQGLAQPAENWVPPGAEMFEQEGVVVGVAPAGLQMLSKENNSPWIVQITRQSEVTVTGTAEPSFLRPGLVVQFTGEIDDKGRLQQDLAELQLVTPKGKNSVGVFEVGAAETDRPIGKLAAGTYEIRGKVVSFKEGELTVQAGKKIVGKLADDAKIGVNVRDLGYVVPDSEISVTGFYFERMKPDASTQRPGQAMGKQVQITLSKPLAGKAKPTKAPRNPKVKTPDETEVDTNDPFGLEKK